MNFKKNLLTIVYGIGAFAFSYVAQATPVPCVLKDLCHLDGPSFTLEILSQACGKPQVLAEEDYSNEVDPDGHYGYLIRSKALQRIRERAAYYEANGACRKLPRDASGKIQVMRTCAR